MRWSNTKWCSNWPPFSLSVSPLDCESLNIMFGFDFTYRGNHNQLLVEAWAWPRVRPSDRSSPAPR